MTTIEDILREMRDWDSHSHVDCNAHELIAGFADSIEAAYKRDVQNMHDEMNSVLECAANICEYREALRCIALSARAALKEEEV